MTSGHRDAKHISLENLMELDNNLKLVFFLKYNLFLMSVIMSKIF
jgi:hypothetical protein